MTTVHSFLHCSLYTTGMSHLKIPNFNSSFMTLFPRHVVMWGFNNNTDLPDTGRNEHTNTERSSV